MKNIKRVGLGVAGVVVLLLTQASPAHAEGVGQPSDVVGIGSDTIFIAANFIADGDTAGDLGFNASSLNRRMISVDPTGDANGRLTTLTNPVATVQLRAGQLPVARPNGSGAGINFMTTNDITAPYAADFVRSSALPSPAQQQAAVTAGEGGLHCFQMGIDGLQLAVSNLVPTDAGTQGLSVQTLVQLYSSTGTVRKWSDVPGYNGPTPNNTIHAIIPQSSAGTFTFFNAQLTAANGGTPITYRTDSGLTVSEEHDPTPIQNDPDAIGPFSTARKSLLDSGYFGAGLVHTINLQSPPTNPNAFAVTRPVFIIVRQNSVTDHTGADGIPFPWRGSGATGQNWVEALFGPAGTPAGSPGGFMARSSLASPLVTAAGFTYSYSDAGLCHS
jgi:ABC-type phosphate transport system substrate-binding protein